MVKTFRLPNGVTVVCEERPQSGKVSMQINFKAGSANETIEDNGLTFLMQEACNGGTKTRSRAQLSEDVESKGGTISTVTRRLATTFGTSVLTRYAGDTFGVLADMVRNPAFDPAELKKTKMLIEQMIDKEGESPQLEAGSKFFETAFAGQAIGENPMGSKALVDSFTPEQIKQKHAELLAHPENIIVSFAGDIDAAEAEKLVKNYFGDLPAAAAVPAKTPVSFTAGDYREQQENEQINIQFGFEAPNQSDPDRYTAMMLEEFLSGGMSSPLFVEIREKRGLVYSVGAAYSPIEESGLFRIVAGAGKGNAGELISVSMDLLGQIIRDGVDQTTLEQARERFIMSMKESAEKAKDAAAGNSQQIMDYGRTVSVDEIEEQLKKVTSDDIRRLCAKMLKDGKYALSAVGPQDTMPSEQEIKNMMQKQVQGVTLPAPALKGAAAKTQFTEAAQEAQAATAVEPKITTLKNGMKIVTVERPGSLACGAWVGAGSDHETPVLNGATHMNEHMMFKGTPSYAPGEIDRIIDGQLGGGLNAYTTHDRTAYYFYNLKPDALGKITDICGEMVFKANLDHDEFDGKMLKNPDGTAAKAKGERDVVIEELKRSNDNIGRSSWDIALETAYPDQPHGRTVLGTEETLRAMTVQQLAAYRDEFYAPNNVVFCAVGPVNHEDFVKLVESKYGQMQAKQFPPLPTPEYKGGTAFIEHHNANMCDVKILAEGVPTGDPEEAAYDALGEILGGGSSSRLYKKVVDEQGLSAGVAAGTQDYMNGGMFCVLTSVAADKVKPFVNAAYAEMRNLANTVTQEELDKVKIAMETALLSDLETNNDACDVYACGVQTEGKIITQAEMSAQIQNLTLDDIKRVLKKVLASNPTLSMIVPPGTDPNLLPKQEEVVAMRDGKQPPKTTAPQPNRPSV